MPDSLVRLSPTNNGADYIHIITLLLMLILGRALALLIMWLLHIYTVYACTIDVLRILMFIETLYLPQKDFL